MCRSCHWSHWKLTITGKSTSTEESYTRKRRNNYALIARSQNTQDCDRKLDHWWSWQTAFSPIYEWQFKPVPPSTLCKHPAKLFDEAFIKNSFSWNNSILKHELIFIFRISKISIWDILTKFCCCCCLVFFHGGKPNTVAIIDYESWKFQTVYLFHGRYTYLWKKWDISFFVPMCRLLNQLSRYIQFYISKNFFSYAFFLFLKSSKAFSLLFKYLHPLFSRN